MSTNSRTLRWVTGVRGVPAMMTVLLLSCDVARGQLQCVAADLDCFPIVDYDVLSVDQSVYCPAITEVLAEVCRTIYNLVGLV